MSNTVPIRTCCVAFFGEGVIQLPSGTRIWIAAGFTDMRRGFHGLSAQVQTVLELQPFSGHVFLFRGRRGDIVKCLWFDGDGLCLFAKRLDIRLRLPRRSNPRRRHTRLHAFVLFSSSKFAFFGGSWRDSALFCLIVSQKAGCVLYFQSPHHGKLAERFLSA